MILFPETIQAGLDPLAIVFILAVIAGFAFLIWKEKKRSKALAEQAGKMGFSFSPEHDQGIVSRLSGFSLFRAGYSQRAYNLLEGQYNGINWWLFDYSYTTRSGTGSKRSSHTHSFIIAYTEIGNSELPSFSLGPEGLFHKIGSVLGFQDINFERNPEFSKKYRLKSKDDAAARQLFNMNVLHFFESRRNDFCLNLEQGKYLFYKKNQRLDPAALNLFLREAADTLQVLLQNAPAR